MPDLQLQILLVVIAFFAGIGITAIGPGGIFLTIALYALLPLSAQEIAGTASATFIATGVLGSVAYVRSGELRGRSAVKLALLLSAASVIGAFAGAQANVAFFNRAVFGVLLGAGAALTGIVILARGDRPFETRLSWSERGTGGVVSLLGLGLMIGLLSAMLGVGGPVLMVPALVVLGVPMLLAVAAAQVQSVFIAGFATVGYVMNGAVVWPLALLVGVPQLAGALVGWRVAQRTSPAPLRRALAIVLLAVAPLLAI